MIQTYKEAGVDIKTGENAVDRIKANVKTTFSNNVLTDIGSFGGCFQFPKEDYDQPILVSSADGVGTKLKIAFSTGKHDTIGQCLVNHCVNDILAIGAQPLFFLDYFAAGKLDVDVFENVVSGLSKACRENNCALIGGETAEMPGFYQIGEYDISGTIVGVAEKENMLPDRQTDSGDLLIGLPSTGLHTNGYSLARKVLLDRYHINDYINEFGKTVGEELLTIHKSYLSIVKELLDEPWLKGISHITGGGIVGNTKRIIRKDQSLEINWDSWEWLPVFRYIQEIGEIPTSEMQKSMNLGIGLILIINPSYFEQLAVHFNSINEKYIKIGVVK